MTFLLWLTYCAERLPLGLNKVLYASKVISLILFLLAIFMGFYCSRKEKRESEDSSVLDSAFFFFLMRLMKPVTKTSSDQRSQEAYEYT
jgi:hypothetical protein